MRLIGLCCFFLAGSAMAVEEPPARAAPLDEDVLAGTLPAGKLLEQPVHSNDGRELGKLADVVIIENANVKEYLVETPLERKDSQQTDAVTFADDVADYGEHPIYASESTEGELLEPYLTVPPHNLHYDTEQELMEVKLEESALGELPRKDRDISRPDSGVYVSDLIGMRVDVADTRDLGEIKDVLLSDDGRKVAAFVVQEHDGPFEDQQLAFPAWDAEFVRAEKDTAIRTEFGVEAVAFPFGRDQLATMPEYQHDDGIRMSDEENDSGK